MQEYKVLTSPTDFKFVNLNVSNTKGSRKKRIIAYSKKRQWLVGFFKYEKYNCSEACSEKLSYEMAKILKKPCARIEFAKDENEKLGIISFLFVDSKQIHIDARDFFNNSEFNRKEFLTISNIQRFLDIYGDKEFDKFIGMMVFDALVGETDRHEENWGLLKSGGKYKLSPLYDTSCNLLREFKEEEYAQKFYQGIKDFEKYILNSKTCIYKEDKQGRYTHFELVQYLFQNYPTATLKELKNLERLTNRKIKLILNKLPNGIIDDKHKEYIYKYITKRKNILLNIIKKGE